MAFITNRMVVLCSTHQTGFLWEQIDKGNLANHNPEVINDLTLILPTARWQYNRWLKDRVGSPTVLYQNLI